MLSQGDLIYLQKPAQNQQRVLIPMDVIANQQDHIIIETSDVFDWVHEDGQVMVYFDKRRDFMKQSAKMELVVHEETEDQIDGVMRYTIELLGDAVSAESRQCFRVSTVISDRKAILSEEGEVKLVDVSATGFAVIASKERNIGQIVKTVLIHEGREFAGTACVQSICELSKGQIRYGMYSVEQNHKSNNLTSGLRTISMDVQREQLRRLSRAS